MKRRAGFTLIELLTVMIIIGLLAAIAVSRFWAVKERSYRAAVKSDLRTVAVQQERYFDRNYAYASDPTLLPDFTTSPGVTIGINWTASRGWAATATHASMVGEKCGYFNGEGAPAGVAGPATESGKIVCDGE